MGNYNKIQGATDVAVGECLKYSKIMSSYSNTIWRKDKNKYKRGSERRPSHIFYAFCPLLPYLIPLVLHKDEESEIQNFLPVRLSRNK